MKSFLQEVAQQIKEEYFLKFSDLTVVLPSQRACLFLKRDLISILGEQTTILPKFVGVEQFIAEVSGLKNETQESLLFYFFESYLEVHPEEEKKDLESFLSWAQMLLQDFNEIDRYLVEQDDFFNYLYYIKDQNHWFLQENKTKLIQNYVRFWQQLADYYAHFTNTLLQKGIGYQGLQYRKAAENISNLLDNTDSHFLFVGFNALNEAEQLIIQTLVEQDKASVIWDADAYFVNDKVHDASYFLKKHVRLWKNPNLLNDSLHNSFEQPKNIQITGIPKNIGQVKYVGQLLSQFDTEKLSKTAVVLADENLLLPLLNSLPSNVGNVNITMGQSFQQLPLTSLIDLIFAVQSSEKENGFYHKNVVKFFQHFAIQSLIGKEISATLLKHLTDNNIVFPTPNIIINQLPHPFQSVFQNIFQPFHSVTMLLNGIIGLITVLEQHFKELEQSDQQYYCQKLIGILQDLQLTVSKQTRLRTLKSLIQIYNMKISAETVDIRGEPFQGLQIMGVLESRCLDFENVILLSINEGTLPAGQKGNSFIPFDLKSAFSLPTYKEKDAIYSYHFYRLLQRCNNAYLIYNTEVDEFNSGEKSRFIHQLEYEPHPNHHTTSAIVTTAIASPVLPVTQITKTAKTLEKLKVLANNGFSPSALATYLRNPMQYYEQYILGVQQAEIIEEEVAANTLGTIIHEVLCSFYTPLEGKIVLVQDVENWIKQLDKQVATEFQKHYSTLEITSGYNLLSYEAAKQFLSKFLQEELELVKSGKELHIVSIEKKYKTAIAIDGLAFPIYIKGTVDRVDRLDGKLRIIDYKTGFVNPSKLQVKDWDSLHTDEDYSKALQILMYAYMYCENNNIKEGSTAGIIAFKKLNSGFLTFKDASKNEVISQDIFAKFLAQIKLLITEICDITIPFTDHTYADN